MTETRTAQNEIICSEIWGGIEAIETTIAIPGMYGVLYAKPSGAHAGGDVYYTTACHGGLIGRICLADLTGHGEAVTEVSQWFHDTLRSQMHQYDPSGIMDKVNAIAVERGLEAMATAACFSFYRKGSEMRYCYAGHPPAFVFRQGQRKWEPLTVPKGADGPANVVLGVTGDTRYDIGVTPMDTGDRLFVYSDGVTETRNGQEEQFGPDRLLALLNEHADAPLDDLPYLVLDALRAHAVGGALDHDDLTVLCFEVDPPMRAPLPYYVVRNQIRKRMRARKAAQKESHTA
jgi:sigma-B regulation protein RsbU (phosphoserine phosphatase)